MIMLQEESKGDSTSDLAALLARHRKGLAEAWAEAVCRELPNSRYAALPREELVARSLAASDTVINLLAGGSNAAWPATGLLSPSYLLKAGFDISDVIHATLLSLDVSLTTVRRIYSPDSATAEQAFAEMSAQFCRLLGDFVTELAVEAKQQVEKEQARTAIVLMAARAACSTLELTEVLHRAGDVLSTAAGMPHCWFFLMHRGGTLGGTWVDAGEASPAPAYPDEIATGLLTRCALEQKRPLSCPDAQADLLAGSDWARRHGLKSALAVPLIVEGHVLGIAVALSFGQLCQFTPEQVCLVQAIANVISPAIENAKLYRKSERIAVMEERARLSRELHDDVAQVLGWLSLQIASTRELISLGNLDPAEVALAEMARIAEGAYLDLREAIFCLRASVHSGPEFWPALREYLAEYQIHYGVDARLVAEESSSMMLSSKVGTQLFRIVLESLTNVRKHSEAGRAWVRVEREGKLARVTIEDDGRGFDAARVIAAGGSRIGVGIMRERAESVGGTLELDSGPGRGTRVVVRVPLAPVEGSA